MKPILKLGFVDYFKPIDEFFIDVLSDEFLIIRDDNNPEYLIFCDENFGTSNHRFNNTNVTKIFYTGENRRPWNYHAHHAITFDHMDGPQFYRLPLYVVDHWVYTHKLGWPDLYTARQKKYSEPPPNFCSFIVKNGGCEERNNMFDKLSAYKKIDSPGVWKNNCQFSRHASTLEDFHFVKLEFMAHRKFNLCYENSSYPGYCTEKLFQALYAGTVPIYWGSPTVELDFPKNAYISRHNFETDEDMIAFIKNVDTWPSLYDSFRYEPVFLNKYFDTKRLARWFRQHVYKG